MKKQSVCKTYQYKLMPTPQPECALEVVLLRCRMLYNTALEQRKTWWGRGQGIGATYYQQKAELPDLKAACPEYAEVNAQVLHDVILRVERTYQAFFRRVKNGETPSFPRFHGKDRYHSFTYPQYGGGVALDGSLLGLAKIGHIPLWLHRPLEGTPKTVTISQEAAGWYVSFSCTDVPTQPLPPTRRETGVDVGLKVFLVTAAGEVVENPRHYRKAERALKKTQKRVSRRKKGSYRRKKAVALCATAHLRLRRQRRDFHHNTALALVWAYDTIYFEDLRVANMVRNHHLAKSIADAGWSSFRIILDAKAAWAGRWVIAVPAQYTSQDCSGCGERVPKSLSIRTHLCPSCGLVMDRDENAARNMQWAGQALRGVAGIPAALNREASSR